MINGIERVKKFGIFENYTKPPDIEEFSFKNIIYGWNYSGKTTVSRIFQAVEEKEVNDDFSGSSFELSCEGGGVITQNTLPSCSSQVRVFNSDFVENNLNWNGSVFDPILLLGNESIEAQKRIEENAKVIERCRTGYGVTKSKINVIDKSIRDGKTKKASQIKQTLSLVKAFTATHINQILPLIEEQPEKYIQDDENLSALLKKALASESDKLDIIDGYTDRGNLHESLIGVQELLEKVPEMSNTISYLAENNDISEWVKRGLGLHKGKDTCEFCGNELGQKRLESLRSHFSKDLMDHEEKIKNQISKLEKLEIKFSQKHIKEFYSEFHAEVTSKHSDLKNAIKQHNNQICKIIDALKIKMESQYSPLSMPEVDMEVDNVIERIVNGLNLVVARSNLITTNFDIEKKYAVNALKTHYIAELALELRLSSVKKLEQLLDKHLVKYESLANALKSANKELEAQISNAQKGREELNKFIDKFLGSSNIRIEVVNDSERERFVLMRGDAKAKNLSEGEKTAIAFSFFLVKLWELNSLDEAIVYIDDPISSLDSNHLFQVNAVIKDFFFWKDESNGNEWKLKVKQIFFSTHNFEFLSLLKELPMGKQKTKYYLVKRISTDNSVLVNLPASILRCSSEYHYLWNVIHSFHVSETKGDIEVLLGLPNAVRRFIELYTYSKIPSSSSVSVDRRADILFGTEKSKRIMKVLHHFSHLNNMNRMAQNTDLMSDIENVVKDLVEHISQDTLHYDALMEAV